MVLFIYEHFACLYFQLKSQFFICKPVMTLKEYSDAMNSVLKGAGSSPSSTTFPLHDLELHTLQLFFPGFWLPHSQIEMIGHDNSLDALPSKNLWFQTRHGVKLDNKFTFVEYWAYHGSKVINHSPKELILKSKLPFNSLK